MRRIKVQILLAPATIYQHAARFADAYVPAHNARFAAVNTGARFPWGLFHRRTGMSVGSLLPALPRKLTMTDVLAVAAAFEAHTELDWQPFDDLPDCTPESKLADFQFADRERAFRLATQLRAIAAQTLGQAIAA